MPAPPNRLKSALAGDAVQIGLWLGMRSRTVAEIAAGAGFDWCLIDGEHGPFDLSAIEAQLQVIGDTVPTAVRVPAGEVWMIKQVLDLGAQTVLVPMVETAEQAARMVQAMRYPPEGIRGMGAAVVRASGYHGQPDYPQNANAETCLMVQAESRLAIENIDAIAATEGVDCVFIGPADLSCDMGLPPDAPEVLAAIEQMIARIRAAGKAAGIVTYDREQMRHYANLGVAFMAVGSDVFGLASWMRGLANKARHVTKR